MEFDQTKGGAISGVIVFASIASEVNLNICSRRKKQTIFSGHKLLVG